MPEELLLLYFDYEHAGDTMFVKKLATRLRKLGVSGPHRMVVHGSGPQTEQSLEGEGLFVDREEGVFAVSSQQERAIVERSIREINQRVVSLLTDEQVSSVSIQGVDRGLLRWEDDKIHVGNAEWLRQLSARYVTPVISALGIDRKTGGIRELPAWSTVSVLARTFKEVSPTVVCFTTDDGRGIQREGKWASQMALDALTTSDPVPEPETIERLVDAGVSVMLTGGRGFSSEHGIRGTRVVSG